MFAATMLLAALAGTPPEYAAVQQRLQQGWNTWNTRSVLSYVHLPEGFAVNLAFKQHYWLDEKYLAEALIGRRGNGAGDVGVEQVRPGLHSYDGYSELRLEWETIRVRVEAGRDGDDLVVLITPLEQPASPAKVIVESAMLWNRPGTLSRGERHVAGNEINVYVSAEPVDDPYVPTRTPYLAIPLGAEPIGLSSGRERSLDEIRRALEKHRARLEEEAVAATNDPRAVQEAYLAIQSGISWNTIYEPKHDRVVSTVGRLWNEEYGGYCLFGWDNFFLAYMTVLESRDLAYANVVEHLRGATGEGFVPNDNAGNGRKSWDHSQPPVGSIMVREVYRNHPEKWFLEETFDALLAWNRWWPKARLNDGLLAYGSHEAKNPFHEKHRRTMTAAGYESGMDDSPMYEGVPFNPEKNTMELQDVGLNSLYVADCKALAEIARVLGRTAEENELRQRAERFSSAIEHLWDEDAGLYLNRRTDTGESSRRLSPTLFYPLLAGIPDEPRARRMIDEHLLNPEEFAGTWVIPSIARNDPAFPSQRYWKGAIWPPLNFLTYLALREAGFEDEHLDLASQSLELFLKEWRGMGYVSENYSSITGTGDDPRLSSDRFHSWGALMGMLVMIEEGIVRPPEEPLENTGER